MKALSIIKFIGAWGCLGGAVICVVLLKDFVGLPMLLSVMSLAFSQAPAGD